MSKDHLTQAMADEFQNAFERYILFGPEVDNTPMPKKGGGKKPRSERPRTVFRIIDRKTGRVEGVQSPARHEEYDFDSPSSARRANCHGIHSDPRKFKIAKYRVTYTLIEDDVDLPPAAKV